MLKFSIFYSSSLPGPNNIIQMTITISGLMLSEYKCHLINLHRPNAGIALIHWTETAFWKEIKALRLT